MGADPASTGPPAYVIEGSFLHALQALSNQRIHLEDNWKHVHQIHVTARNEHTIAHVQNWFCNGALTLESAAASQIAHILVTATALQP